MAEGLKIVIGADVSQAEKALIELTKPLDALESQVGQTSKAFTNLSRPVDNLAARTKNLSGAMATLPRGISQANSSLVSLSRIAQDAPFGFIAIQNNITELIPTFQRLRQETGSNTAAFKALFSAIGGAGGVGLAISLITSALTLFSLSSRGAKKDTEEHTKSVDAAVEKQKEFAAAIDKAAGSIVQQASKITDLRALLLSTSSAVQDLTDATIKQGVAAFLFDKKNLEVQKLLNAEIQKSLKARTGGVGLDRAVREFNPQLFAKDPLERQIGQAKAEIGLINSIGGDLGDLFKKLLDKPKEKAGSDVNDIISKAKELAKELEKLGFIQPKFNFFDSVSQQLEKARKVFADFKTGNLKINPKFFDVEIPFTAPRPESIAPELDKFREGIQQGLIGQPPVEIPAGLTEDEQQVASVISDFREKFKKAGVVFKFPAKFDFTGTGSQATNVLQEELDKGIKLKGLQDRLKAIVTNFSGDLFVGLGQAIGDAISGSANVFDALFKVIAAGMKQFGEALIALGTAKLALDKLFKGPQGGILAIGAGIALIALSTIVSNFQGPKFAKGGLVTGPTLGMVGEGRGTSQSNPEVIAPLDKLKGILGDLGTGSQVIVMNNRIRGKDIVQSVARTSKSQRRLGARV